MVTVDAKGRIVLPKDVRERLGLTPGTEVAVHEDDGRVVVEPEDRPDRIVADLESMIEAAATERDRTPYDELDPDASAHVEAIRRQARTNE